VEIRFDFRLICDGDFLGIVSQNINISEIYFSLAITYLDDWSDRVRQNVYDVGNTIVCSDDINL